MQAGCELIGTNTPEAQAELIALAYKLLENVGLKNITLSIGNLNILSVLFEKLGLSKKNQKYLTPLIDKSQFEGVYDALVDFGVKPKDATVFLEILQSKDVEKISEHLKDNEIAKKELNGLKTITGLLENAFDVKDYEIKMSIVRGLDYYNGLVFEIEAPCLGAEKQLCGGGAYDLIELFGGRESPTSGFAIGFDRTLIALETEGYKFTIPQLDAYLISVNEDVLQKTLEIAQMLRKQKITTDVDLLRRGIGKSLKYASSINAKKAIIVGPKELEQDSVTIRNMETGDQEIVKIKDIVSKIK
jgi:histidyl-tRNA synthetase